MAMFFAETMARTILEEGPQRNISVKLKSVQLFPIRFFFSGCHGNQNLAMATRILQEFQIFEQLPVNIPEGSNE